MSGKQIWSPKRLKAPVTVKVNSQRKQQTDPKNGEFETKVDWLCSCTSPRPMNIQLHSVAFSVSQLYITFVFVLIFKLFIYFNMFRLCTE